MISLLVAMLVFILAHYAFNVGWILSLVLALLAYIIVQFMPPRSG